MQAATRFTYPGGMESWDDLVDLIAPRPGVEPATFRSRAQLLHHQDNRPSIQSIYSAVLSREDNVKAAAVY